MGTITLLLSLDVLEAASETAAAMHVNRDDLLSLCLEGSTYLAQVKRSRHRHKKSFCPVGSTNL